MKATIAYSPLGAADDTRIQKFYDTLEEVERAARKFDAGGYDAYFALSTFKEPTNRKGPNAHELKSLFLDSGLWSVERIPNAEGGSRCVTSFL